MNLYRSAPIQFNESFVSSEEVKPNIQLLRVGTFFHEGKQITVTKTDLKNMVKNYKGNARGIDLMLDFSHESEKEAAAWFTDVYLSEDDKELWATVDWTPGGSDAVRSKKYRYISADFQFAYKDNETLKDYGPTLFGAGLTNRPVIKKMDSTIELTENNNSSKDNVMELEEMKKKLADFEKSNKEKDEKIKELGEKLSASSKLSEDEESNKRIADLEAREEKIKLAEKKIEDDKKLAEKTSVFDKMLSEGKTVEAQRDAFMTDDFAKFAENSNEVNLSEKGSGKAGTGDKNDKNEFSESETPAQDEVIALAEKKMKEDKELSESDAYDEVLTENKELADKYNKETEE